MAQEKRDSTRNLLEQIEGGWDEDESSGIDPQKTEVARSSEQSAPSLDELDARWGEDLFGGDDEDDEEEEEEVEEPEPELPDERADPVAYAAAKKAREDRAEDRRKKKKAKLDAKRAKKRARAEAVAKQRKQKTKKSRAAAQPTRAPAPKNAVASDDDEEAPASEARRVRGARGGRDKTHVADVVPAQKKAPPWKLIALALVVGLVAAGLVSVVLGRR